MKIDYVVNGTVRFILTPENDLDKAAIKMIAKNQVSIREVGSQDKTQVLEKIIQEGLIIEPVKQEKPE